MQRKQDSSSTPQLKAAEQISALKAAGQSALRDLRGDTRHFEWFGSLMWAIMREADEPGLSTLRVIKDLAEMGNSLAIDRADILEGICARLEHSLDAEGGEQ
ncbi:hypothetical protein [Pseudomonas juntendi]|uniref:hypothetical protein n=1 Tax=Pseudomonas juntendi TaxID=2666183 RepID=UPI001E5EFED6|nr:hypothetical protein [Pseudomonas juntendi]MDM3891446.1 hypothetical protein [Pseudomonas juntendi]